MRKQIRKKGQGKGTQKCEADGTKSQEKSLYERSKKCEVDKTKVKEKVRGKG
jgi:predicted GNAT family acetyltransferase